MNILKLISRLSLFALIINLLGCTNLPDMHSNGSDKTVPVWQQTATTGELKVNLLWAKPIAKGPLPTIIVHPGMLQSAGDMQGVLIDLAEQGFLAVAIDYQRLIAGKWQVSTMPIREEYEIDFIISQVTNNPWVDASNIGLLGFSLGGAHSLNIAKANPAIKAVVAYYPMTDFVSWAEFSEDEFILSMVVKQVKSAYLKESASHTNASHFELVSNYSAVNFADEIQASVLVIHGDDDDIAPLEFSKRFVTLLQDHGNEQSQLMIVNQGTHGFNFKRSEKSIKSWLTSVNWMNKHLLGETPLSSALAANTQERYEK